MCFPSKPCRLGGVPEKGGIELCPGPCDVRAIQPGLPVVTSPKKPAAVYKRGQNTLIKYQRNNHGPGGFVRYSLVPLDKMMDKESHARNAFHFGCWGENAADAKTMELGRDAWGFSLVGGDGKLHDGPIGFYYSNITIPQVVPDGLYVLGWVWYGGMGGGMKENKPDNPYPIGLFADYWSCSFVEISGGPVKMLYTPVFKNDLQSFWPEGCNAHADAPGQCKYEPCRKQGRKQEPKEFKGGKTPKPLKASFFTSPTDRFSRRNDGFVAPTPVPYENVLKDALVDIYNFHNPSDKNPKSKRG